MAFEVVVRPITLLEIDEAIAWYEKELSGLGNRFLRRVDECINKIKQHPESYLIIYPPVRRILLKTFPYKLLYFIKEKQVIVI